MICCTLLYVHSSFAIILMEKRELVALLGLPSWCLVIVVWLFLAVLWVCLRFVIVVFPDHTHLLFLKNLQGKVKLVIYGDLVYKFKRIIKKTGHNTLSYYIPTHSSARKSHRTLTFTIH